MEQMRDPINIAYCSMSMRKGPGNKIIAIVIEFLIMKDFEDTALKL